MQLQLNPPQQQYAFQTQPAFQMVASQSQPQPPICQHLGHISSDEDSGFDIMDDSLTDMQWLQRMDAGMLIAKKLSLYVALLLFSFCIPSRCAQFT